MKYHRQPIRVTALAVIGALAFALSASAHCDGLDGPVVKAAEKALASGNVKLVLMWVQKGDEPEITEAFGKTLSVRKLNPEARDVADRYFFETLVRVHRAGEGEPFTGLKPAGRDLGPAIPAGDKALETGNVQPVLKLLSEETERGLHRQFEELLKSKQFDPNDSEAGRAFVRAYVEYIHYVQALYAAAAKPAHGHFAEDATARHAHEE